MFTHVSLKIGLYDFCCVGKIAFKAVSHVKCKLPVVAGHQCYFRSAVVDYGQNGNMHIAVMRQKTSLTNSQSSQVVNDLQRLDFSSRNGDEIQVNM